MIAKKNSGHDLERKRSVFFQVGLLTAASFTLAAFTYTTPLPGANNERLFSLENQATVLDFEPEPEKRVEEPLPATPPQMQQSDPTPSDPTPVGNPDLQDARANANQNRQITPIIGPPTGGVQRGPVVIDEDRFDPFPLEAASYRGGYVAMQQFIKENIRYPQIDLDLGNEGIVNVSFVIERNGTVSNVKVLRGVSETIDREAIRVVRLLNQWIPAQNATGTVRTEAFLPIRFHVD